MSLLQKRVFGAQLRAWGFVALLLPLFVLGVLNLVFSTSWGTGFFCDWIEDKIGLPCDLESVTWSPWAGVSVSKLRVFAPNDSERGEAVLSVGEARLDVSWSSLLKGENRWERLVVDQLDVNVSIETIHEILARSMEGTVRGGGITRSVEGDVEPTPAYDLEDRPELQKIDEPQVVQQSDPAEEGGDHTTLDIVDDFEGVIILSNANVNIFSNLLPGYSLKLDQIDAEIPLWGSDREGMISCASAGISKGLSESGLKLSVAWKDRSLLVMTRSLKAFGLNMELSAVVRLTRGFPAGFQLDLPEQQIDLSPIFPEQKSPLSVGSLASGNRLQGYLLIPSSFRGGSVTRFKDVVIEDLRDAGEIRFDRGSASVLVTAAGIVARDIRAIGEEDAVLANGFASTSGNAAATVRLVSSPVRAESHEKRVRMADGNLLLDFQPFITPDREFRDIRIEARDETVMMDLGEDRSWVSCIATAKAILGLQNTEPPNLP